MRKSPLEYALFLLKIRDRSIGEIRSKMMEKKIEAEIVNSVIKDLIDKKFLDDERFANNYVRNQLLLKPQGKYRLKQKLKKLFLDEKTIEVALLQLPNKSESKLATELAERWLSKKTDCENKYEKLGRFLAARGFSYEIIKETFNRINL